MLKNMSQLLHFYSFINGLRMAKMFFTKRKISLKQNQKNSKYYYIGLTNVWITLEPVIAAWISCDNHKVALCFKHLLDKFPSVADCNSLWG